MSTDAEGRRRLDAEGDFVRLEVVKALERPDVTVVPVLVEGAQMPAPEALPAPLAPLTKRNATQLTSQRWRYDVGQIVRLIKGEPLSARLRRVPGWVKVAVPLAAVAAAVGLLVLPGGDEGGGGGDTPEALPPATVAPAVGLCSQQLEHAVNGTVGPLSCAGGSLNQLAWEHVAEAYEPETFTLGPNATPDEVGAALCEGLVTIPIADMIYDLAQLYYGWSFALEPDPASTC